MHSSSWSRSCRFAQLEGPARPLPVDALHCPRLARENTDVIDLKIADAALAEMGEAFRVFRPFRAIKKMTIFGSARTAA